MNIKISIKNLEKTDRLFAELKEKIKPEIIDKSLDSTLSADLSKLKLELLNTINNEIKSKVTIQEQEGKPEDVVMKRSDQEIIKHLTGVDLEKLSKTKDFNTLADGNISVASTRTLRKATNDRTGTSLSSVKMPPGINLRIPMSEIDSFESQYSRALTYFNSAIFVFVDNNGKSNYYVNPGIDMSQYVKVFCSRETGNTQKSSDKWDLHKEKRGYADWTLLSIGVDRIKSDFINVTDVVDKVKTGEYEEANNVLTRASKNSPSINTVASKIDDLKNNKGTEGSVQSYNNLISLVKNLKLEKTVRKDRTFYTLVSIYDQNVSDYKNFQEKITEEVKFWKLQNEQRWVETIVKSIVSLANKLSR